MVQATPGQSVVSTVLEERVQYSESIMLSSRKWESSGLAFVLDRK